MLTNTEPTPTAVIDVAHESWGRIISDRRAHAELLEWLAAEGLDPNEVQKAEVFYEGSPFPSSSAWAWVYTLSTPPSRYPLKRVPPLCVLAVPGVWRRWGACLHCEAGPVRDRP